MTGVTPGLPGGARGRGPGSGNGCDARPPPRFHLAQPPVGQRRHPDGDEQPGDAEPGDVDVEAGHQRPECAVQMDLGGQDAEDLDGADDERGADGQPGDDQVVVDLADRPGERPAVGEVHEQAVQRVEQHHACGVP